MRKKAENLAIVLILLWIIVASVLLGMGYWLLAASAFVWWTVGAVTAMGLFYDEIEKERGQQ